MCDVRWKRALFFALPIAVFILGAFYYWFAVSDRYTIFLYGHLDAMPFDAITVSRYWMASIVAAGLVMIGSVLVNWLWGRLAGVWHRRYVPPRWWQVWLICAPPLVIGIPLITMSCNQPTLPLDLALVCALVALVALVFALLPGSWAAERPAGLAWLALDGAGLMPCLLLLRAVDLPQCGVLDQAIRVPAVGSVPVAQVIAAGAIATGIIWLVFMTVLRRWRRKPAPTGVELFVAGLCLSYLLMPVVHYLLEAPAEYRYISTASNFFATDPVIQGVVFLAAAVLAWGVTGLRLLDRSLPADHQRS